MLAREEVVGSFRCVLESLIDVILFFHLGISARFFPPRFGMRSST